MVSGIHVCRIPGLAMALLTQTFFKLYHVRFCLAMQRSRGLILVEYAHLLYNLVCLPHVWSLASKKWGIKLLFQEPLLIWVCLLIVRILTILDELLIMPHVLFYVSNHLVDLAFKAIQVLYLLIFIRIVQLNPQDIVCLQRMRVAEFLATCLRVEPFLRPVVCAHDAIIDVELSRECS